MILHLLLDEKFSDYVVDQFASKEMQSDFALVSDSPNTKYFHHVDAVSFYDYRSEKDMRLLLKRISSYNAVLFHGLFAPWQEWLLNNWPMNVKIAWSCWGGEIYGQPDVRSLFLKPLSRFVDLCRNVSKKTHKGIYVFPKHLLAKASYCLSCAQEEYNFVKSYLNTDIRHLWYTYYTIDEMLGALKGERCSGGNIFVGNSATIENNYLETFIQVKRVGIRDRQIIVPLSYGDAWVRNMILKFCHWLFGKRFAPLVEFMPREEYNKTMLNCCVMIQPHLREQAHGNLVTGLWLGMRVYLSENGIDYKHFKSIGCRVYSIEHDLRRSNPDVFAPMSDDDVAHNRKILTNVYGREHIDEMNIKIVKELA